jgi:FAS-associated factor 2
MSGYSRVPKQDINIEDDDDINMVGEVSGTSSSSSTSSRIQQSSTSGGVSSLAPVTASSSSQSTSSSSTLPPSSSSSRVTSFISSIYSQAASTASNLLVSNPPRPPLTVTQQAAEFIQHLRVKYQSSGGIGGDESVFPPFEQSGFELALQRGARENRAVLIYIHSDLHGDTDEFVRNVFLTSSVANIIRSNQLIVWGGSVHSIDGLSATVALQVTGFPFLGLYTGYGSVSGGGSSNQRARYAQIWMHEGLLTANELVATLTRLTASTRDSLERVRLQQNERNAERVMRNEQESAYEIAMRRDAERQEMQLKEAAIAAAAEEEKRMKLEEDELASAIELSQKIDTEWVINTAKARLTKNPEPDLSIPKDAVSVLRLTLPTGTKVQRRFKAEDTLSLVRDFVYVSWCETRGSGGDDISPDGFSLSSSFPKKVFTEAESTMSLYELKLVPQAVLFATAKN